MSVLVAENVSIIHVLNLEVPIPPARNSIMKIIIKNCDNYVINGGSLINVKRGIFSKNHNIFC